MLATNVNKKTDLIAYDAPHRIHSSDIEIPMSLMIGVGVYDEKS